MNIPEQYINNLDTRLTNISQKISENIDEFNRAIIQFITRRYGQNSYNNTPYKYDKTSSDSTNDKESETSFANNEGKDQDKSDDKESETSFANNEEKDQDKSDDKENDQDNLIDGENKENDQDNLIDGENDQDESDDKENDQDKLIDGENKENEENDQDESDDNAPSKENDNGKPFDGKNKQTDSNTSQNNSNNSHNSSVKLYTIPELVFPTKKKYVKKFFKKLIVKLHPDKVGPKHTKKFAKYYDECKVATKQKSIYKLWLISKKIKIKIKINKDILKACIVEINILKKYIDNLENSIIVKWIDNKDDGYIRKYILNEMIKI